MWLKELLKNLRIRLSTLLIVLSLITLLDEVAKEGYIFDPLDLINTSVTHEKLFIIFLIAGILLGLRRK